MVRRGGGRGRRTESRCGETSIRSAATIGARPDAPWISAMWCVKALRAPPFMGSRTESGVSSRIALPWGMCPSPMDVEAPWEGRGCGAFARRYARRPRHQGRHRPQHPCVGPLALAAPSPGCGQVDHWKCMVQKAWGQHVAHAADGRAVSQRASLVRRHGVVDHVHVRPLPRARARHEHPAGQRRLGLVRAGIYRDFFQPRWHRACEPHLDRRRPVRERLGAARVT